MGRSIVCYFCNWEKVEGMLCLKGKGSKSGQPVKGVAEVNSLRSGKPECWNPILHQMLLGGSPEHCCNN